MACHVARQALKLPPSLQRHFGGTMLAKLIAECSTPTLQLFARLICDKALSFLGKEHCSQISTDTQTHAHGLRALRSPRRRRLLPSDARGIEESHRRTTRTNSFARLLRSQTHSSFSHCFMFLASSCSGIKSGLCLGTSSIIKAGNCSGLCSDVFVGVCSDICSAIWPYGHMDRLWSWYVL